MVLKVKVSPDLIAGDVDEGYGKVADVFRRNLTSGQEVEPSEWPNLRCRRHERIFTSQVSEILCGTVQYAFYR